MSSPFAGQDTPLSVKITSHHYGILGYLRFKRLASHKLQMGEKREMYREVHLCSVFKERQRIHHCNALRWITKVIARWYFLFSLIPTPQQHHNSYTKLLQRHFCIRTTHHISVLPVGVNLCH